MRKNRQANTAVPCLPNTGQFSCPHKNLPRKQPQTKISYSIFLQKREEILKILLFLENPLTNKHPHTRRLLLTHSNLDKNRSLTIATSSLGHLFPLCFWAPNKVCLPPKMPNPRSQSSGSRITAELKLTTCQTKAPESLWSQFVTETLKIFTETGALW